MALGIFLIPVLSGVLRSERPARAGPWPACTDKKPFGPTPLCRSLLYRGLPFAAHGRYDAALFFHFRERLVHVFSVQSGDLRRLAGVQGFPGFFQGFQNDCLAVRGFSSFLASARNRLNPMNRYQYIINGRKLQSYSPRSRCGRPAIGGPPARAFRRLAALPTAFIQWINWLFCVSYGIL